MTLPTRPLTVTINGRRYGPMDVPEGLMMIDVLHEMLGLTGSRLGCGHRHLSCLRGDLGSRR
jgi:aerobic-type carbon monoxide dehydrogenase small subunit (CoxS/CutS family)